jgi:hypothetical protein
MVGRRDLLRHRHLPAADQAHFGRVMGGSDRRAALQFG